VVELARWQNFYVIVGSAGGALIGVQFVVIALLATMRVPARSDSIHAFGTPNVVHLGSALLVSALMNAPWPSLLAVSIALAMCGLGYGAIVIRRARRQTSYKPVWDDWVWYTMLPCSVYTVLTVGALLLAAHARDEPLRAPFHARRPPCPRLAERSRNTTTDHTNKDSTTYDYLHDAGYTVLY
jgi:hypothetical protein